jgi:uncharacterized protein YwgA
MDPRHAVLIAVEEEGPSGLVGRTLLQKKLYFASLLVKEDLDYRPHYYGPYSRSIADATDSLVSNRFLDEQVEVFPQANLFGERRRHSYRITSDGRELLESIDVVPDAGRWHEALRKINDHQFGTDFNLLSIAAKVLTVLTEVKKATGKDISQRAAAYGWNLEPDAIGRVAEFLKYLGLVRERA